MVVITGDFFLADPQITKEDKAWLYPQMIKAIKKVKGSIILVFFLRIVALLGLNNLPNRNLKKPEQVANKIYDLIFNQENPIIN